MKKENKEILVEEFLKLVSTQGLSSNDDLNTFISYLQFFGKEIIEDLITPIFRIDSSFSILDTFELEVSKDKKYEVTLLEVLHEIESEWAIKKIKILSSPGRTAFLGGDGLYYLQQYKSDKIKSLGKEILSFASKHQLSSKDYIPGLYVDNRDQFQRSLPPLDSIIKKGKVIAVFKNKQ